MARVRLRRVLLWGGGLILVIAGVLLAARATPRPVTASTASPKFSGADLDPARRVETFRAGYDRWKAVLGFRWSDGTGQIDVSRETPGRLSVAVWLSSFGSGADEIQLDDRTLMLEARAFGDPGGAGQTFSRDGLSILADVRATDGTVRNLRFTYPVPVFEPSVLELPLGLMTLEVGQEGFLAWSNFGDEDDHWLPYRVLDAERIEAAGRAFDTHRVRVRFPGGMQRDYWIASEPPYKIRMVAYQQGRLVTTGWELTSVERID